MPFSPYIPILATLLNLFLTIFLFFYSKIGVLISAGYILLGVLIYYVYSKRKEFEARAEPVIHAEMPVFEVEPRSFRILAPLAKPETADQLLQFATLMAKAHDADITALNVIQVPAQLPPSEGRKYLSNARSLLDRAVAIEEKEGIPVYTLVKVAHNIPKAVIETCEEKNIDLMVLGWEGDIPRHDRAFGTILDEIILNTVCDIAMVRRAPTEKTEIDRVLIPVTSIRYALLSIQIAEAVLQDDRDIPIVLFHATEREDVEDIKKQYEEELQRHADQINPERYEVIVRRASGIVGAVLAETQYRDLIIMGAPEEGLVRRAFFGDIPGQIARAVDVPVILTKRYTGSVKSWFQKFFGTRKTMLH